MDTHPETIVVLDFGTQYAQLIARRVRENHGAEFIYGEGLVEHVLSRCTETASGGRAIDNILTNSMLPRMSAEVLTRMARGEGFSKVEVSVDDTREFQFALS